MRTFLRYGALVVELVDKPLVIGRARTCDIQITDDLASREHCRISAHGDRVLLEDLGSRNGVLVNGVSVDRAVSLYHGDTITIGSEQLMLMRSQRPPNVTPSRGLSRQADAIDEGGVTGQGNTIQILTGAATRSLAAGDLTSAEASARSLFVTLRTAIARSRPVPSVALDAVAGLALVLAEKTGELRWIEQLLELFTLGRVPMEDARAKAIAVLSPKLGRPRALDEYLRVAREIGAASAVRTLSAL